MANIVTRIKDYIDYKGISVFAFEKSVGMSNASFGKSLKNGGAVGSDKLENILSVYSDISPHWLLTGEGEMLTTSANSTLQSNNSASFTELLAMINDLQKRNESLSMQLGAAQERIRQLEEEKSSNALDAEPSHTAHAV